MAYFNQALFKEQVAAQAKNKSIFVDTAFTEAAALFNEEKKQLINEFNNHPVTKEIEAGPDIEGNPSETLGGSRGNLFSFIGFDRNKKPVQEIRDLLEKDIKLRNTSLGAVYKKDKIIYKFPIEVPSTPEIENASELPWEKGQSWVTGIEKGISGLGNYIFKRFFSAGRSKTGLQMKGGVSGNTFIKGFYLPTMLKKFIAKFR